MAEEKTEVEKDVEDEDKKSQPKKRGRPKKQTAQINESTSNVRMSTNAAQQAQSRLAEMFYGNSGFPGSKYNQAINRGINAGYTNNPFIQNQRIKKNNEQGMLSSKDEIMTALQNVDDNEQLLRQASTALYYQNYIYGNLLRLHRDIPQFFNYVVPEELDDPEEYKSSKFKKEINFVNHFLKKFDVPLTFKTIALDVAREGKCSYIYRQSLDEKKDVIDFTLLQKLPQQYIKYTGYGSDSPLIVSFDFAMFLNPMFSVSQYPQWFADTYEELIQSGAIEISQKTKKIQIKPLKLGEQWEVETGPNGSYAFWVELPQDLVYTFGTDISQPYSMPDYVGLFPDLADIDSYKWLQAQTMLTNITQILTGEVPFAKDAQAGGDEALLSPEVIIGLENDVSQAVNDTVYPFFAPLQDFDLHSIQNVPNANNIVLSHIRDVMSTAGVSGLISANEKPSIAQIKSEQLLFESKVDYLTKQFQKFLNMVIDKYLDLTYDFKVIIWGGVYNYREDIKQLKELVNSGNKGLLPRLLSAYNTSVEEYAASSAYVNSFDAINEEQQSKQSKNKTDSTGSVGRPSIDNPDNDNTAASQDLGQNVSDIKEF